MQERELEEKIYFCIDTSFFLYSYTSWKVVVTHERSHLFTWVFVEQISVLITLLVTLTNVQLCIVLILLKPS